jgi:hypothetical protein
MCNRWLLLSPVVPILKQQNKIKLLLASLLLGLLLTGCAGIPVQEMSDARQALQTAAEVGAKDKASTLYSEASGLLTQAESALKLSDYGKARELADKAKEKAILARKQALSAQ